MSCDCGAKHEGVWVTRYVLHTELAGTNSKYLLIFQSSIISRYIAPYVQNVLVYPSVFSEVVDTCKRGATPHLELHNL